MARKRKLYDKADIPIGQWYPDKGERVFIPKFNSGAVVLEICPYLQPGDGVATEILYFVELDNWGYHNKHYDLLVSKPKTRTLVRTEDISKAEWFPINPLLPASG